MRSFAKLRYLRVLGFAAGAVVATGAAVLVTASAAGLNVGFRPSTPTAALPATAAIDSKATTSPICNNFIPPLSSDLGKTRAQVKAPFHKAIGERLADESKNKDLTQAQADAIKKKLTSQPPCSLDGFNKVPDAGARARIGAYPQ